MSEPIKAHSMSEYRRLQAQGVGEVELPDFLTPEQRASVGGTAPPTQGAGSSTSLLRDLPPGVASSGIGTAGGPTPSSAGAAQPDEEAKARECRPNPPAILIQLRRDHAMGRTMPTASDLYRGVARPQHVHLDGYELETLLEYISRLESAFRQAGE